MSRHSVNPRAALHVARRIQRGRPQAHWSNRWILPLAFAFAGVFWISLIVIVINYISNTK